MGFLETLFLVVSSGAFIGAAFFVLLFSFSIRPRKSAHVWFILAFGLFTFSVYNYLQISNDVRVIEALTLLGEDRAINIINTLSADKKVAQAVAGIVGSVSIVYGLLTIFYEIRNGEVSFASKRYADNRKKKIWKVIENVTERFKKGQIDDHELTNIRSDLVRELAELDTEIKGKKK